MSFDSMIVCVGYDDPLVLSVVLVCTGVWCYAGRRLPAVLVRRDSSGVLIAGRLFVAAVVLLMVSPMAIVLIIEMAATLNSPGVFICLYFVRNLLYVPGVAGTMVMILSARRRRLADQPVG